MSYEGSAGEQRPENTPTYKSTPLRPVIIMTIVLVWAFVVALIMHLPSWASLFLAILTGASFLAFMVGYVYLFVKDRESLRTGSARRTALAAKPDAVAREAVAVGGLARPALGEPTVISVPEAERVAERRYR